MNSVSYVALTLLKILPLREVWSVYKNSKKKRKKPSAKTVYLILIPQAAVVSLLSSSGL